MHLPMQLNFFSTLSFGVDKSRNQHLIDEQFTFLYGGFIFKITKIYEIWRDNMHLMMYLNFIWCWQTINQIMNHTKMVMLIVPISDSIVGNAQDKESNTVLYA